MTEKHTQDEIAGTNAEKDPDDWVTGDEPMTGAQRSYLETLSEQARVEVDPSLTKAQASRRIDELQQQTGRGRSSAGTSGSGGAAGKPGRPDEEGGAAVDELDVDGDGSHSDTR